MPRQPAADRTAVHPEASSNSHCPDEWPRFEVCINGRCPIEDTLNVIAGRWKILVLWWLQEGELRFGELRRRMPTITQKMLTQQLRQMETEGLVDREVFAQVPPKVIYRLTERGQSLRPVLRSLYDWSRDHPPLVFSLTSKVRSREENSVGPKPSSKKRGVLRPPRPSR